MELIHVERGPEQGGSIVGYAQFSDGPKDIQDSVAKLLKLEKERKLDRPETIRRMYKGLESVKTEVRNLISDLRKDTIKAAKIITAMIATPMLTDSK